MRAVIISGGRADIEFIRQELTGQPYDMLIAADSGLEVCYALGITPDVMLGDYDSVSRQIKEYYQNSGAAAFTYPERKDETDTELAVKFAIDRHAAQMVLYGATGSRLDHTLANLSLLKLGLLHGIDMQIRDKYNRIRLVKGQCVLQKQAQFGDYISLLPFSETVEDICLKGFRYPLDHGRMAQGNSLGISNVLEEERGVISAGSGILMLIESRDE